MSEFWAYVNEHRKAILAGLVALVGSLATAAHQDGISTEEWLTAAGVALVALGAVGGISNGPPSVKRVQRRIRRKLARGTVTVLPDVSVAPTPPGTGLSSPRGDPPGRGGDQGT